MKITPSNGGGRVVEGDTPYGRFRTEWNARGQLVSHEIEIRTPGSEAPLSARSGGPCAVLKAAIRRVTGEVPCGECAERCRAMDRRGWAWCAVNLRTIAGWLKEAADQRADRLEKQAQESRRWAERARAAADALNPDQALSLLRAAWKEIKPTAMHRGAK